MKLAVSTICPHIYFEDQWWSYEPFVVEMNIWSEMFEGLVMLAPLETGTLPKFWAPYKYSEKIAVIPYRQNKGHGLNQQPASVLEIPRMLLATLKAIKLTNAFYALAASNEGNATQFDEINKDDLPVGLSLTGTSMRGGFQVLDIKEDGYYIGPYRYDSLSSAAEAVSGVRRSGWTFWRLSDGRTIKEAFGKR